jgi:hypothetical protein
MQSNELQAEISVSDRAAKIREAFQKASPEAKVKVFELAHFSLNSEPSPDDGNFQNIAISQWEQGWDQSWPQWGQSHW